MEDVRPRRPARSPPRPYPLLPVSIYYRVTKDEKTPHIELLWRMRHGRIPRSYRITIDLLLMGQLLVLNYYGGCRPAGSPSRPYPLLLIPNHYGGVIELPWMGQPIVLNYYGRVDQLDPRHGRTTCSSNRITMEGASIYYRWGNSSD